jgi:hypothetical protein
MEDAFASSTACTAAACAAKSVCDTSSSVFMAAGVYWYFWNHKSRTFGVPDIRFSKTVRLFICEIGGVLFQVPANWSVATLWGTEEHHTSNDATSFGSSYRAATSWYGQSRQWTLLSVTKTWTGVAIVK